MKTQFQRTDAGNTLICALCTILVISFIGANVLINSTTRYNVTSKQLKGWKEALYAAEAGGDIGFAEVRKLVSNPSVAFSSTEWITPAASPAPTPGPSWSNKNSITFGTANSLTTTVTVDKLTDPAPPTGTGYDYYRIRATGTARLLGLPRTGMDDRFLAGGTYFGANASTRGVGDSLLRKIDYKNDHFKATYGDGDGIGLGVQPVANPQITRRIELVVVPKMVYFDGALKVTNSFKGPGSSGIIDSYSSKNGAYTFVADNPLSPIYSDSRNGDVSVATPSFAEPGKIYGNVSTNGGNVKNPPFVISGTIDNNVPFTIPALERPTTTGPGWTAKLDQPANAITPPATAANPNTPAQYTYSSLTNGVTIFAAAPNTETYVTIVVGTDATNGNIRGSVVISANVNAKIYFTGNVDTSGASKIVNNNIDNAVPTNPSRAGHVQLYGISPTDGFTKKTITIDPNPNLYAVIYAPNHDVTMTGNAQIYGSVVCHDFGINGSGGGNTGFHYDKQLATIGTNIPIDYQIASYVEDTR